jgi:hypothetical protein
VETPASYEARAAPPPYPAGQMMSRNHELHISVCGSALVPVVGVRTGEQAQS